MLTLVKLADRFSELERSLPDNWGAVHLVLTVDDDARCDRAAALLGPANPGRLGKKIRFAAARRGSAPGPDAIRRLLRRLDAQGITCDLELAGVDEAPTEPLRERTSLRTASE